MVRFPFFLGATSPAPSLLNVVSKLSTSSSYIALARNSKPVESKHLFIYMWCLHSRCDKGNSQTAYQMTARLFYIQCPNKAFLLLRPSETRRHYILCAVCSCLQDCQIYIDYFLTSTNRCSQQLHIILTIQL